MPARPRKDVRRAQRHSAASLRRHPGQRPCHNRHLRPLQSANRLGSQVCVGRAKAASGLQRVFEAHRGVPPIQHDCGVWQRIALQPPQPGVAVAQHRRRRVRGHAGHCERLLERTGCNRRAVARESEAGLAVVSQISQMAEIRLCTRIALCR